MGDHMDTTTIIDWGNAEDTLLVWRVGLQWRSTDMPYALSEIKQMAADKHPRNLTLMVDCRSCAAILAFSRQLEHCLDAVYVVVGRVVVVCLPKAVYAASRGFAPYVNFPAFHVVTSVDAAYNLLDPGSTSM